MDVTFVIVGRRVCGCVCAVDGKVTFHLFLITILITGGVGRASRMVSHASKIRFAFCEMIRDPPPPFCQRWTAWRANLEAGDRKSRGKWVCFPRAISLAFIYFFKFFYQRTKSDDRLLKISQLDINLQSVSVTVLFPVRETTVASWWLTRTPWALLACLGRVNVYWEVYCVDRHRIIDEDSLLATERRREENGKKTRRQPGLQTTWCIHRKRRKSGTGGFWVPERHFEHWG